jgi:acyl carrier protein
MKNDIESRLAAIMRDVLGDPRLVITRASNAETLPGYDSLAHINIISAVEQEFDLRFELADILDLNDVGDMVALIERKVDAVAA